MKTKRPQRVYLIVRDPDSGVSKTLTIYDINFKEAVAWLRSKISETVSKRRRKGVRRNAKSTT